MHLAPGCFSLLLTPALVAQHTFLLLSLARPPTETSNVLRSNARGRASDRLWHHAWAYLKRLKPTNLAYADLFTIALCLLLQCI